MLSDVLKQGYKSPRTGEKSQLKAKKPSIWAFSLVAGDRFELPTFGIIEYAF
jgi:hypothetical protein